MSLSRAITQWLALVFCTAASGCAMEALQPGEETSDLADYQTTAAKLAPEWGEPSAVDPVTADQESPAIDPHGSGQLVDLPILGDRTPSIRPDPLPWRLHEVRPDPLPWRWDPFVQVRPDPLPWRPVAEKKSPSGLD